MTVDDHLRMKRLDLGLLQKDVAQYLGVNTSSVINWEKNHNVPMDHNIPGIIEFLGYDSFSEKRDFA